MTRIAVTVALLCAVIGASYWAGGRTDRLKDEIDRRDTLERMQDATDPDIDDDSILDSLRKLAE